METRDLASPTPQGVLLSEIIATPEPTAIDEADCALKAKHKKVWGLGDYPAVAKAVIPDLGRILVKAGIRAGQDVLDVAAGSGNATIPAAQQGARVVGQDLTPALLAAGKEEAELLGLDIDWSEGDAEALDFADDSFDVVISCLGLMFAPHHQTVADETLRVVRPGGTIGLLSWTPEGFIGQMLAAMRPYAPPPPPSAQPPPLWGTEAHVRELFGDRAHIGSCERGVVSVTRFATPEEFRDYFKTYYGPTVATYQSLNEDPSRIAGLDEALDVLARRFNLGNDRLAMEWEYLLITATAH